MPGKPIPKWFVVVAVILLAAGLLLAAFTGALGMKEVTLTRVRELLQALFVVALFVERSLEVFIIAWRGPESAARVSDARSAKREVATLAAAGAIGTAPYLSAVSILAQAEKERDVFDAETKRIRLIAALVVGVLIAASGMRSFETFVQLRATNTTLVEHIAGSLFNISNVLITGGLIGGGSDLINKILKVITEFLDRTVARLRGEAL
jgi:hypothetical protein